MKKLFVLLAFVQLVPVWAPLYFPTQDGATHVYNAWAMRELALGHDNLVTRTYEFDRQPHPNFVSHIVLAVLLGVFKPAVAEKLLVSAIVLLFLGAVWFFAGILDAGARVYAFLALPLAHHQLLQFGFYNFCIATALALIVIALWWKRRHVAVAVLLLVCYFSHPLPTAIAVMAIGIEWLLTLRQEPFRRHAARLLAIVPVLPLLEWYAQQGIGRAGTEVWTAWDRVKFVAATEDIVTFDGAQRILGIAIFVTLVALMIATAFLERHRRGATPLLAILAATIVLYIVEPPEAAGGAFVLQRIALFLVLLPLPWLTPRLPRAVRIALVAALSIASVAHAAFLAQRDRDMSRETTALVRAAEHIPPEHTFMALVGNRRPPGAFMALFAHTSSYAALDRRLVDLDNYEPTTGYFPLKFRTGVRWRHPQDIEQHPANLNVDPWVPRAEYVFTWRLSDDAPVFRSLDTCYALVWRSAEARVYQRYER